MQLCASYQDGAVRFKPDLKSALNVHRLSADRYTIVKLEQVMAMCVQEDCSW